MAAKKEKLVPIDGQPPDLLLPPKGCPFADRCQYAMRIMPRRVPELLTNVGGDHRAACWLTLPEAPKPEGYREGARN